MVTEDEEKAFWILAAVVEGRMGYYCQTLCGLLVDLRVLEDLVSEVK